jgi:hypothetical protein
MGYLSAKNAKPGIWKAGKATLCGECFNVFGHGFDARAAKLLDEHFGHFGREEGGQTGTEVDILHTQIHSAMTAFCLYQARFKAMGFVLAAQAVNSTASAARCFLTLVSEHGHGGRFT